MARIAGINIPPQKHSEIGLTAIFGIGRTRARKICEACGIAYSKKVKDLTDGDLEKILPLVRQAVELGADIIKADPTDDPSQYHHVIRIAGDIPVLVRGGGKAPEAELLQRTQALLEQGIAGLVYGRNIIQHDNPAGMTRALMAMLHDNADAAAALTILQAS